MAAPTATTSSGFTLLFGSLPNSRFTASWTAGIRVIPPTKTTSLISLVFRFASRNALRTGSKLRAIRSEVNCSTFARVKVITRCFGPVASAVIYGKLISVCIVDESSIFAFSAASFNRCNACRSWRKSMLFAFLNSSIR